MPAYTPYQTGESWGFETAAKPVTGLRSRESALRTAEEYEREDRALAETGEGAVAQAYRKFFQHHDEDRN